MRRTLVALGVVAVGGCGRVYFEPLEDSDSSGDNSDADAEVLPRRCSWTGSFTFTEPQHLIDLGSNVHEQQPHLQSDGLALYFASARSGGVGGYDVYVAERSDLQAPFGAIRNLELNTAEDETAIAFTADGLIAFIASNRDLLGPDIYEARRGSVSEPLGTPVRVAELSSARQDYDPFPVDGGLTVYYVIRDWDEGLGGYEIVVASRPALDQPFASPVSVAGINSAFNEDNPSLTADGLLVVFGSDRPGTSGPFGLYYATRADPQQPFSLPLPVPGLESAFHDSESFVTRDGCEVYFTSIRDGQQGREIYRATYVQNP